MQLQCSSQSEVNKNLFITMLIDWDTKGNSNKTTYPVYGGRNRNQFAYNTTNHNECKNSICSLSIVSHDSEKANRRMAYENGIQVTWSCRFCNVNISSDKKECTSCNRNRAECVRLDQRTTE